MLRALVSALLLAPAHAGAALNDDAVMRAAGRELQRSFAGLANAEKNPLYYLGYRITDGKFYRLYAEAGAVVTETAEHNRYIDVETRVGSPELDNTHEFKGGASNSNYARRSLNNLPIENDEDALRVLLWRHTEFAFKQAQERYAKVSANKAITAEEEDKSADFSKEPGPEKFYETVELPALDKALLRGKVERYSRKFLGQNFIFDSYAAFNAYAENRYILTSEGTRVKTGNIYITLSYNLSTRATDGMLLSRGGYYTGTSAADLPSDRAVLSAIDRSIAELRALKDAPVIAPYSGPAILKNRAAAVFFHEIFGHRVEGHRQKSEMSGQTFARKIGEKVVSGIISIREDPSMERFNGVALRGYYKYDNQGVRARSFPVVEKGVLKNFFMWRSPVRGFLVSNGHARGEAGYPSVSRMGNMIITADNPVSFAELRQKLIAECKRQGKPFGLVFDDISGGFTNTSNRGPQSFKVLPLLVYKVYANGRQDEVVRGVDIVGTPLASFGKIIAAADDPDVFNGTCGAESGSVPVSAISPSLLVSEIEVERTGKSSEKPPVLPPPYNDGGGQ